ncbi:MAG: hypothetical protein ACREGK_10575 [Geminicoccales bacterium]
MSDYLVVFGLALLPAFGNFSGGLMAEYLPTSKRNLNRALHAASGIVIAIVAVELVPRALPATSGSIVAFAFGLGGLAYVGLAALVERLQKKRSDGDDRTSMWMI